MSKILSMIALYNSPKDFPGKIVTRRWEIRKYSREPIPMEAHTFETVEQARASIPAGLRCIAPLPGEDPILIETWL